MAKWITSSTRERPRRTFSQLRPASRQPPASTPVSLAEELRRRHMIRDDTDGPRRMRNHPCSTLSVVFPNSSARISVSAHHHRSKTLPCRHKFSIADKKRLRKVTNPLSAEYGRRGTHVTAPKGTVLSDIPPCRIRRPVAPDWAIDPDPEPEISADDNDGQSSDGDAFQEIITPNVDDGTFDTPLSSPVAVKDQEGKSIARGEEQNHQTPERRPRQISILDPSVDREVMESEIAEIDAAGTIHAPKSTRVPQAEWPSRTSASLPTQGLFEDDLSDPTAPQTVLNFSPTQRRVTLAASVPFRQGDELLLTKPTHGVLSSSLLRSHCSACFVSRVAAGDALGMGSRLTGGELQSCPDCKVCVFCESCFETREPSHRTACLQLRNAPRDKVPSTEARLVIEVLAGTLALPTTLTTQPFLNSNLPDDRDPKCQALVTEVRSWWSRARPTSVTPDSSATGFYETGDLLLNDAELMGLIRRIRLCTFPMYDSRANHIGLCLHTELGRMNHSCEPNAQIVFPFDRCGVGCIRLIATRDILDGEEITISYCDPTLPVHLRPRVLQQSGFFDHRCEICLSFVSRVVDPRYSALHPHRFGKTPGLSKILSKGESSSGFRIRCPECDSVEWRRSDELPMVRAQGQIGMSVKAEQAGDLFGESASSGRARDPRLPNYHSPTVEFTDQPDLHDLLSYLNRVKYVFPETHWPCPILNRRAARLYLDDRGISPTASKVAVDHLQRAVRAYVALSEPVVTPTACAVCIELLDVRVVQLAALVDGSKPILPRLQRLRYEPPIRPPTGDLRQVVAAVRTELDESGRLLDAVYRHCRGDLWERYQRARTRLVDLLRVAS